MCAVVFEQTWVLQHFPHGIRHRTATIGAQMNSQIHSQVKAVNAWKGLPVFTAFLCGASHQGTLTAAARVAAGRWVEVWPGSHNAVWWPWKTLATFQQVLHCDPSQLIQQHWRPLLTPRGVSSPYTEGPVKGLRQLQLTPLHPAQPFSPAAQSSYTFEYWVTLRYGRGHGCRDF